MNQLIVTTIDLIRANWIRALIGGFVGTVVFTLMGFSSAVHPGPWLP